MPLRFSRVKSGVTNGTHSSTHSSTNSAVNSSLYRPSVHATVVLFLVRHNDIDPENLARKAQTFPNQYAGTSTTVRAPR